MEKGSSEKSFTSKADNVVNGHMTTIVVCVRVCVCVFTLGDPPLPETEQLFLVQSDILICSTQRTGHQHTHSVRRNRTAFGTSISQQLPQT